MSEERKERCETCRFWECTGESPPDVEDIGDCHKRPPLVVLNPLILGKTMTRFPETVREEWCGEWESRSVVDAALTRQKVWHLTLSARARKGICKAAQLKRTGKQYPYERDATLADLIEMSEKELLEAKNVGMTTVMEIKDYLAGLGLNLKNGSSPAAPVPAPPGTSPAPIDSTG